MYSSLYGIGYCQKNGWLNSTVFTLDWTKNYYRSDPSWMKMVWASLVSLELWKYLFMGASCVKQVFNVSVLLHTLLLLDCSLKDHWEHSMMNLLFSLKLNLIYFKWESLGLKTVRERRETKSSQFGEGGETVCPFLPVTLTSSFPFFFSFSILWSMWTQVRPGLNFQKSHLIRVILRVHTHGNCWYKILCKSACQKVIGGSIPERIKFTE